MTKAWRAEDERLLSRLEDESIVERLWAASGCGGEPPHRRAAGLIAALRASAGTAPWVDAAREGDLGPLLRCIEAPPDPARLTPELAHHLALWHARTADALESASPTAGAHRARLRSIAMWLWLADEQRYLERVAGAVVAGALGQAEVARNAAEVPFDAIDRLGRRARGGARELGEPARLALEVLLRVGEAASAAKVSERIRRLAEKRAARERAAAIDEAVARVDAALAEAGARAAPAQEIVALLADGMAVWRWSGRDEQVERFLVERVTPLLWERYRERRWDELRAMLQPLLDAIEHLAARIERDPAHIAYAAPCAQMIVFRAEVAQTFEKQLELAERAVALCPTHRNGRLVLADLLIERAMRGLDVAMPWGTGEALAKAARDVRRADELFPMLKRIAEAKQRLKAMGRDVDAA